VINLAAAHHDRPHGATLQNRSRGRIKPVITSGRRTKVDGPATHRPTCSGSGRRARLVDASARPYRHPDQVIERQPAQTHAMMPSRHSRPSHMFWPAVWNSQFDNKGHQKERAGPVAWRARGLGVSAIRRVRSQPADRGAARRRSERYPVKALDLQRVIWGAVGRPRRGAR